MNTRLAGTISLSGSPLPVWPAAPTPRAGGDGDGASRLLQRVLGAREEERARLAGELREMVAQPLVAIAFHLAAAKRLAMGRTGGSELEVALASVREATEEITAIADSLYPGLLGELGLLAALESLRRRITHRARLGFTLSVEGEPFMLPLPLTRALYRFAEEVLENVEQHGAARSIAGRVAFAAPAVTIEFTDDGCGFDVGRLPAVPDGIGLPLVRELLAREGAIMQIHSVPGRGTRATATATVTQESTP